MKINKDIIRVLVVDDDEDDFYIIKEYLSEAYEDLYDIEWVDNYKSALRVIKEKRHDIFLFDFRLGQYNGLKLLREARANNCNIPVILLTGQNDYEIDMEAMYLGAYDYLLKDEIGPTILERSIRYALERRRMEDELFQEKERAVITLESIGDSVITTNEYGIITNINQVAEKMIGCSRKEVVGMEFKDIIKLRNDNHIGNTSILEDVIEKKSIVSIPEHMILINKNGREYAVEGTASPIHNRDKVVIGAVVVIHDVTNNRELTKRLYHQSRHDALTELPNRYKFEEELWEAFYDVKRSSSEHALLYLDLDQFKIINDTCGHFAGDQFLKQISLLIKKIIRDTDTIARLGGDEFGVLLRNISPDNACKIAKKICNLLEGFRFTWKDRCFSAGVSIGIIAIDTTNNSFESLLSSADRACYVAKEKGGNSYHLFVEDDVDLKERHGQMQWMSRLTAAFEKNQFELYYQPIKKISANSNERSYEILIRLIEEDGTVITPGCFLVAAHRYNMMTNIDRWVVKNFFDNYKDIVAKLGHSHCNFNINLSGASLNNDGVLEFIYDELLKSQIPPNKICFEITETIALSNFSNVNKWVQQLRTLGFRFALDDFGSGLTTFEYLKYLPVDYLKIDGSFIKNIHKNPIDYAMVSSINEIAHLMKMETVAEFVENEDVFNCLKKIGIDYAQGYWIGKPMPI
jgi:diguanylate cyclase (GGDEF)-like protein/PAS domain S-box-containing protein